jgi:glycosyltransferase involved in cell wall biosynthesis
MTSILTPAALAGRRSTTSASAGGDDPRPLIVHIVHSFTVGGLENGLVKLINGLPPDLGRHCVMSLTRIDPAFAARIRSENVEFVALGKQPGQTLRMFQRVYRALRQRRPALVHTRNLATIECQLSATAAGVPIRIHSEHGWDMRDLHGQNRYYIGIRRLMQPLIHHHVTVCDHLRDYLVGTVGVASKRVRTLRNGVDSHRFSPAAAPALSSLSTRSRSASASSVPPPGTGSRELPPAPWTLHDQPFVVGTVGRLATMKNQRLLCEAFLTLRARHPGFRERGRLLVVGDGADRAMLQKLVVEGGAGEASWFTGEQTDVAPWLRAMNLFCLPSLAEGMSNAILEAMGCGLPVIALDNGVNAELVEIEKTGVILAEPSASDMAAAIEHYFGDPGRCAAHGAAGRVRVVEHYSLEGMVRGYATLYGELIGQRRCLSAAAGSPAGGH